MQINVTPLNTDAEFPDSVEMHDVDEVSFVNAESYGPGDRFGITPGFSGRKVLINVNGISCVEIIGGAS